jgi:hypothetical protein
MTRTKTYCASAGGHAQAANVSELSSDSVLLGVMLQSCLPLIERALALAEEGEDRESARLIREAQKHLMDAIGRSRTKSAS